MPPKYLLTSFAVAVLGGAIAWTQCDTTQCTAVTGWVATTSPISTSATPDPSKPIHPPAINFGADLVTLSSTSTTVSA